MSKKKKSKQSKRMAKYLDGGGGSKKSKKYKKYAPKSETIRSTVSAKQARKNRKDVEKPAKVAESVIKTRPICNHNGDIWSVEEFKQRSMSWSAYIPDLDSLIARYGEEHVHVCATCFSPVVDRDVITSDDVVNAMATLTAACSIAVSNEKMTKKEIASIYKRSEKLVKFRPVWKIIRRMEKEEEKAARNARTGDSNLSSLNNNNNGPTFVG